MTTSRKPVEAKIVKMVKLAAPVVARSTNDAAPPPVLSFDPSSKAAISRNGSSTRKPNANWVRRRLSWRRTLPLRVELRRQLKRRRTQFAFGFLVLLPFLLMAAFELGSNDSTGGGAASFVDLATTGAANFTIFTIFASTGFLLVVIVALFAGDTVASEASWSSLRYLLAAPVPRSRLLRQKLLVALGLSGFALVLLPTVALLVGWVAFGWAPVRSALGSTLSTPQALLRLAIIVGYLAVVMLFVAALGFLIGVYTDAPLGAVGGAVLLVIVSNILDAVSAPVSYT